MNRQAAFISWLALPCALFYAWLASWNGFKYFVRTVIDYAKVVLSGGSASLPEFHSGSATIWQLSISLLVALMMAPWARKLMLLCRMLHPDSSFTESWSFRLNIIGRWLIAGCLLAWNAGSGSSLFASVFAAVLIAPEFIPVASSGFTGFIDAVFFPGGREKKPPYTLKLARFYGDKERWEEAEAEYARMLSFYPDRLEAWQERLELAFRQGKTANPDPEEVLAFGLKKLGTAADREALYQTFIRAGGSPDDRV